MQSIPDARVNFLVTFVVIEDLYGWTDLNSISICTDYVRKVQGSYELAVHLLDQRNDLYGYVLFPKEGSLKTESITNGMEEVVC